MPKLQSGNIKVGIQEFDTDQTRSRQFSSPLSPLKSENSSFLLNPDSQIRT